MADKEIPVYQTVLMAPDGSERSLAVAADRHLWDAAFDAGIRLPALCHLGWCLTCAARIQGRGCVDQSDSRVYLMQDKEAGFILPCTAKACSDLRLQTHQARAMREHRQKLGLPTPYAGV